jgi:hypothetical protein
VSNSDSEKSRDDGEPRTPDGDAANEPVNPAARFELPAEDGSQARVPRIPFARRPPGRIDTGSAEADHAGDRAHENAEKASAEGARGDTDSARTSEQTGPRQGEAAREASTSDDAIASVGYEDIRDCCVNARKQRRKTIVVLGLAATGKSFLVKRLRTVLGDDYTCATMRGLPKSAGLQVVDRTKEVLLYRFSHAGAINSPQSFDIYDVPGDKFTKYMNGGWAGEIDGEDRQMLRLFFAIFAFANAVIVIAPALQVLEPKIYDQQGDDVEDYQRELHRRNPNIPLPTRSARDIRARDVEQFVDSLDPMTRVIALLKDQVRPRGAVDDAAVDKAVDTVLAMNFRNILNSHPKSLPLPVPVLLLLSRADELRRRLDEAARDDFDRDPALYLLKRRSAYFYHLARRFAAFSVDFLTAESREQPGDENFQPDRPSYGAARLVNDWLLPAIDHCRRPRWWLALQRPYLVAKLRSWLDADFGRHWKS